MCCIQQWPKGSHPFIISSFWKKPLFVDLYRWGSINIRSFQKKFPPFKIRIVPLINFYVFASSFQRVVKKVFPKFLGTCEKLSVFIICRNNLVCWFETRLCVQMTLLPWRLAWIPVFVSFCNEVNPEWIDVSMANQLLKWK